MNQGVWLAKCQDAGTWSFGKFLVQLVLVYLEQLMEVPRD